MAQIFWLDNRPGEVMHGVDALRAAGHAAQLFNAEDDVLKHLEAGNAPQLIIQDLHRKADGKHVRTVGHKSDRTNPDSAWHTGWRFYEQVLRVLYPSIPVVIVSYDADRADNMKKADDYNVLILQKGKSLAQTIVSTVNGLLTAQRHVHENQFQVPAIIAVDFNHVTEALLRHLARHPTDLHKVNWSTFEELITRVLQELGYEATHTPLTRDGGVDIWALTKNDMGDVLYAIDAKKYSPGHIVGPEPVRAIYGVVQMQHASVGMIVTTARFGPEALRLGEQYRYQLALKDFDGVVDWIRNVDQRR